MKSVLLVCAADCNRLKTRLALAGCFVTKVSDGSSAVSRARHQNLDVIILVSTGRQMDLTETALNLRDIDPAVQIIVVADRKGAREEASQTISIAHAIPGTRILSTADLDTYLASPEWQATRKNSRGPGISRALKTNLRREQK